MERMTSLELVALAMAWPCSTKELHPQKVQDQPSARTEVRLAATCQRISTVAGGAILRSLACANAQAG